MTNRRIEYMPAGKEQLVDGLGAHVADRLLSSRVVAVRGPSMRRKGVTT